MFLNCVVLEDLHCQIGNVLACVGLSSYKEFTIFILRKFLEEVYQREDVVAGCHCVSVRVVFLEVVRVAHSCRRLKEEQVRRTMPRVRVRSQVVSLLIVDTILQVIRTDFLQKS